MKISGELFRAGVVNNNGRVYPRAVLEEAIHEAQHSIAAGMFGTLGNPGQISHDQISHQITKIEMNDDGVVLAECDILDNTPRGQALTRMIDRCEMSARGVGQSVEDLDGHQEITDYRLLSVDFHVTPSAPEPCVLNICNPPVTPQPSDPPGVDGELPEVEIDVVSTPIRATRRTFRSNFYTEVDNPTGPIIPPKI